MSYPEAMHAVDSLFAQATRILNAWDWGETAHLETISSGLINHSFTVIAGDHPIAVMQRLNPSIVPPEVNDDIEAITSWLDRKGILTPRLIRTREGALCTTDLEDKTWRCLTHVGTRTINTFSRPRQARSAARLVACFHSALNDLDFKLRAPKQGAQDTEKHLASLRQAITEHSEHRLIDRVARIADDIENLWSEFQVPEDLPMRIIHGDLKITNIRFDGDEAIALIDLDTFTLSTLDIEIGDALRSWCNTAGEDSSKAVLDLNIFREVICGLGDGVCEDFASPAEWAAIIPGFERITLNLTTRFATDALMECYFGWNTTHGGRGEHNLLRAEGQLNLLHQIQKNRAEMEGIIENAF